MRDVDVVVRTYNSAGTLEDCLSSIRSCAPSSRIIVVDHMSTDGSREIAERFGCTILQEDKSLGYATLLGAHASNTEYILFVDSDVKMLREDFLDIAASLCAEPGTGAVVGCSQGHRFLYGLPLGLTLLRREIVLSSPMQDAVGRETYFLQRELRRRHLRVRYVTDAMIHSSPSRLHPHWPEWQGAQMRRVSGFSITHLLYGFMTVLLMHMNSKSPRNVAYTPIFCMRLMRGFIHPWRWEKR